MRYIFTLLFFQLSLVILFSQDCTDYHQFQYDYADYTYFYSQQSKSMLFMRGQSREVNIITYAGEDYYITVCAHNKFGNIQFRLLEDNDKRTVIYDNTSDNFSNSLYFSNERTRKLIIEVIVPPGKSSDKDRRCVGVLIEFKKTE